MPIDDQRAELLTRRYFKLYERLLDRLMPGEYLSAAAPVVVNLRIALVGLTDRRVVVVASGKSAFSPLVVTEIDLEYVLTVRFSRGNLRAASGIRDAVQSANELIIESRTGDYSVSFSARGTGKDEGAQWPSLILGMQRQLLNRAAPRAPSAAPLAGSLVADIDRLVDLRKRGLLTEDEFAAAKGLLLDHGGTNAAPADDMSTCRNYLVKAEGRLRKDALSFACISQVMKLPVASIPSFGQPLVPAKGLQPAIEVVRQVLRQDASLAAWVARGTLVSLDLCLEAMSGTWDEALDVALAAAGLVSGPALNPATSAALSNREQEETLGTARSAWSVFLAFERPGRGFLGDRKNYRHLFESTSRATRVVAYEVAAWVSVVIGRLVNSGYVPEAVWMSPEFESVPIMDSPGWYPNPYNAGQIVDEVATRQRYWDGDWTDRVRNMRNGLWKEKTWSMFRAPNN